MTLTNENYFSPEASMHYFSVSSLKSFDACEARALAECKGEWKEEPSVALLRGSFIDAYFEGTLDKFIEEHPELFKRDGNLKADYAHAYKIIERVERDPMFMEYMSGEKQVIKTGEIDGFPFKIKIDSYHPGRMIVDLKIMRSMERIAGRSFIDYWDYFLQGYCYKKIEGNNLPFFLAVATSETEPNLDIIKLEEDDMNDSGDRMRRNLPRWAAIKKGEIEPERCEQCNYCKRTKVLKNYISSDFVGFTPKEIKYMKGEK